MTRFYFFPPPLVAADCARAAKLPVDTFPPVLRAVADWIREAATEVILIALFEPFFIYYPSFMQGFIALLSKICRNRDVNHGFQLDSDLNH